MPTGVGYELCISVCGQNGHAEVDAIRKAGRHANGGIMFLFGHSYVCRDCMKAANDAGLRNVVVVCNEI